MTCWLFKEEPGHYSFEQLQMDGTVSWDGVKNNLALKNLRQVVKGDTVLYYHTGDEKRVVGLAKCVESGKSAKYPTVRIKASRMLKQPVSLSSIKNSHRFDSSPLVRMPRLSVMPVSDELFGYILEAGDRKPRKDNKD